MSEILDLVDKSDHIIGSCSRSIIYEHGWHNFRVINAFLKNSEGKLWIPRRAADKKLFPCHLDASVGGHVKSGETYEDALIREANEELNMNIHEYTVHEIGYFTPYTQNLSAFMRVYEIRSNTSPLYNKNDIMDAEWLEPITIIERLNRGDKAKGDLPELIKLLYMQKTVTNR